MGFNHEVQALEARLEQSESFPHYVSPRGHIIDLVPSRNDLLTGFGKATLADRYLLKGETPQHLYARVACAYADDVHHARRMYDAMSKHWFSPATPVLSNGGTTRGFPISCFLNQVGDSMEEIVDTWCENVWLAARGGGIGTYWGNVRSIDEAIGQVGKSSGIIPFVKVMDSLTLAVSQGSLRRGSAAVYLDVFHPEIEEFIQIRRHNGDTNRRSTNIHNGVCITDKFMHAVRDGAMFDLISPKTGETIKQIDARELWSAILVARLETGEPYLLFIDTVNRGIPKHQLKQDLLVTTSNLCSEITLHTSPTRTAVCCLSSLNLETSDEWFWNQGFIEDVMRFLDNVLQDFIDRTDGIRGFERARYAAMQERSVGLGVMGYHSYLQSKGIAFESKMAKVHNLRLHRWIKEQVDQASLKLGEERGPCLDAAAVGSGERFSNKIAIAPTASISIICGNTSPCSEPWPANVFTQKTLSGSHQVENKHLAAALETLGKNTPAVWSSILGHEGSVQHFRWMPAAMKKVFKTASEMDQRVIVRHGADRQPFVCQSQSINLFVPADEWKQELHDMHWLAWEAGCKSLYYLRSKALNRATVVGHTAGTMPGEEMRADVHPAEPEECLSCQ